MRSLVPSIARFAALAALTVGCAGTPDAAPEPEVTVQLHYLEIVTPDVDAACRLMEAQHGVTFSEPVAEFGNARTATLQGGALLGVRAPMHEAETPVVRPYRLVDDIAAATQAAEEAGAEIAMPPTEIPGRGSFAIYFQDGIQHGLWQN